MVIFFLCFCCFLLRYLVYPLLHRAVQNLTLTHFISIFCPWDSYNSIIIIIMDIAIADTHRREFVYKHFHFNVAFVSFHSC